MNVDLNEHLSVDQTISLDSNFADDNFLYLSFSLIKISGDLSPCLVTLCKTEDMTEMSISVKK